MVGIICFWDRLATPYLEKYEKLLQAKGIEYEVVLWNRQENNTSNDIEKRNRDLYINLKCKGSKAGKVLSFFKWKKIVSRILKENNYSYLIVLSTVPAILLKHILIRDYAYKYIFDIRDYTFEANKLFRLNVMELIDQSALSPISSKGYLRWLDSNDKIILNHNMTVDRDGKYEPPQFNKNRINFGFVGNVRLDTQTKALLLQLINDEYIDQYYYGRILPSCDIEQLKEEYAIKNLFLEGPFVTKNKKAIYQNIDLINCVYANAETEDKIPLGDSTPLPNRLYDALEFYRPIVASKGTYLGELVEKYYLGCVINGFDTEARNHILTFVNNFDKERFVCGVNRLRETVKREEQHFLNSIDDVLSGWKGEL